MDAIRVIPYLQAWQVGTVVAGLVALVAIIRGLYAVKTALDGVRAEIHEQGAYTRKAIEAGPLPPPAPKPETLSESAPRDEVEAEILKIYGRVALENHRKANKV